LYKLDQPALLVSGSCVSELNGNWLQMGVTQSGAPFYKLGNNYLYHDPDCTGNGSPARWMFNGEEPSLSASRNLDGESSCIISAYRDSQDLSSPAGAATWSMDCGGDWVDNTVTIRRATVSVTLDI